MPERNILSARGSPLCPSPCAVAPRPPLSPAPREPVPVPPSARQTGPAGSGLWEATRQERCGVSRSCASGKNMDRAGRSFLSGHFPKARLRVTPPRFCWSLRRLRSLPEGWHGASPRPPEAEGDCARALGGPGGGFPPVAGAGGSGEGWFRRGYFPLRPRGDGWSRGRTGTRRDRTPPTLDGNAL
jgi:hypothetical protein